MSSTNLERRRAVIMKRLRRASADEATDIKKWKVEHERQRQRMEQGVGVPLSLLCSEVRSTALPLDWFGGAPPCYVRSAEDQAKERMLMELCSTQRTTIQATGAELAAIRAERSRLKTKITALQNKVDDIEQCATDRTAALEAAKRDARDLSAQVRSATRTIAATNMCGCACTFCGMCVCVYVCVCVLLALPLHRALCARVCAYILCVCAYVYVCVLWYGGASAFSSVNLSSGQGEYAGLSPGRTRTEKHTQTQRALTGVTLPSYTHTHKRLKQHKKKTHTNTKHTNTQTNTQTHKHTNTQTHTNTKHTNTQTNTRTHKHTNTHSLTHSLLCTLSGEHRGKVRGRPGGAGEAYGHHRACFHVASRCHCGQS